MKVTASSFKGHMVRQHGRSPKHTREVEVGGVGGAVSSMVSYPRVLKMVRCSVTGCPVVVHSAGWIRKHFIYRNLFARIALV